MKLEGEDLRYEDESEYDFDHLYFGLKELACVLGLHFDPEYIMQDAALASANSANKYFPNTLFLMCYFHVMQNVRFNFF